MAFDRANLRQLIDRTTADLVSRLELNTEVYRRAVVRVLAKVWAGAVHGLHGHLDWVSRQLFVATADTTELELHGLDYGIARAPGAFAVGFVHFTGADDAVIPLGTRLQRADGSEYLTTVAATISNGQALAAAKAVVAGAEGNTDALTSLTLVSPLAAVFSTANAANPGLTGGLDPESDESYRARILLRKRQTPQGGSIADYLSWTRAVPGVTNAWAYGQWIGAGTVGITFTTDLAGGGPIPSEQQLADVRAYIDERRPVTAEVIVFAPTSRAIDLSIAVHPDTPAVRAAIAAELADLLLRQGAPGSTLARSQISEAISSAPGEISHNLIEPAADLVFARTELPTLGSVAWL